MLLKSFSSKSMHYCNFTSYECFINVHSAVDNFMPVTDILTALSAVMPLFSEVSFICNVAVWWMFNKRIVNNMIRDRYFTTSVLWLTCQLANTVYFVILPWDLPVIYIGAADMFVLLAMYSYSSRCRNYFFRMKDGIRSQSRYKSC